MKTFFVLGREPAISAAEIISILRKQNNDLPEIINFSNEILVLNLKDDVNPAALMDRLGGTIKIGFLTNALPINSNDNQLTNLITKTVLATPSTQGAKKIRFGFSIYNGSVKNKNEQFVVSLQKKFKKLGIMVKRTLEETGLKARWVVSALPILSSVIVKTNRLLREGAEVVIIVDEEKLKIGYTATVQPFEALERRDFGRPSRETRIGMLPPKLARVMINLAGTPENTNTLDPFCGSGTILTEALLLGYTKIFGADIAPESIQRTRQNIDWFEKTGILPKTAGAKNVKLIISDIRELDSKIEPESIDAIITELHLGPPLRGNETRDELEKIQKELTPLYNDALKIFHKLLQKNGLAIVAFPLLRYKNEFLETPILNNLKSFGFEFISPIPNSIKIPDYLKEEFGRGGKTLIYGRPDQRVWREIAILHQPVIKPKSSANASNPA